MCLKRSHALRVHSPNKQRSCTVGGQTCWFPLPFSIAVWFMYRRRSACRVERASGWMGILPAGQAACPSPGRCPSERSPEQRSGPWTKTRGNKHRHRSDHEGEWTGRGKKDDCQEPVSQGVDGTSYRGSQFQRGSSTRRPPPPPDRDVESGTPPPSELPCVTFPTSVPPNFKLHSLSWAREGRQGQQQHL